MAFVLSSAVHAAVLWPLVTLKPAAPRQEPPHVLEVTLTWPQPAPTAVAPHPAEPKAAEPKTAAPRPAAQVHPAPVHPVPAHPARVHAAPAPPHVRRMAVHRTITPVAAAVHVHAAATEPAPIQPAPLPQAPVQEAMAGRPAAPSPPPLPAGPAPDRLLAAYARRVLAQLEQHKTYPIMSQRRGEEGTITLRITVAADGRVIDVHPVADGPSRLVHASLDAVTAAAPFPPLPAGLGANRMVFNLPITYRLH